MRCRDVEAMWDEIRDDSATTLKETVHTHLRACPPCQELYHEFEGVAYCLSCLPQPEPSCDLAKKVVEHIATLRLKNRTPILLCAAVTPIGRVYVGYKERRIAYIGIDTGEPFEAVSKVAPVIPPSQPMVTGMPPESAENIFKQVSAQAGSVNV